MKAKNQFREFTLSKTDAETPLCQHLEIEIDNKSVRDRYRIPGQYATIRLPGEKPDFFAMSNRPGEKKWSFLVKKSSPLTHRLADLKVNDRIEISPAQGKGFMMKQTVGKNILLLAVGSAIAPIRAVLLQMIENRADYGDITLYYGAIAPEEFAYKSEFGKWKKGGVEIIQTLYPPQPGWKGLSGFVQNHLPKKISPDTAAFVCGMDKMVAQSRQILLSGGLSAKNILTNI